jgi:cytochrome c553
VTGHFGGMLVHGPDYIPSALPGWMRGAPAKHAYTGPTKDKPGPPVDFAREVEPLFKKVCYECHNEDKQKGDLRMDSRADLLKGGASGPGVVPGDPQQSAIIQRVLGEGEDAGKPKPRMPKKKDPLTDAQIELLERWVAQGANYAPATPAK